MYNSYICATPNQRMYTYLSQDEYLETDRSLIYVIKPESDPNTILYIGRVYAPTWTIETSAVLSSIHKKLDLQPPISSLDTNDTFSLNKAYRIYRIYLYRGTISDSNLIDSVPITFIDVRQIPYFDRTSGFSPIEIFPIIRATNINHTVGNDWYKSGTLYRRISGKVTSATLEVVFYNESDEEILRLGRNIDTSKIIYEYHPEYTVGNITSSEATYICADYRLSSSTAMYSWAIINPKPDISSAKYAKFNLSLTYTPSGSQDPTTISIELETVKLGVYPNDERNDTWLLQWYDSNGQYCCLPCRGSNKWKSTASRNSYMKTQWDIENFAGDVTYEVTLNTGWLDEDLNPEIEGIFNSHNVWITHCSIFTNTSDKNIRPISYDSFYQNTANNYPSYTGMIRNLNDSSGEVFVCTPKSNYQEKSRREDRQLINYTINLQLNKKQVML